VTKTGISCFVPYGNLGRCIGGCQKRVVFVDLWIRAWRVKEADVTVEAVVDVVFYRDGFGVMIMVSGDNGFGGLWLGRGGGERGKW